MIHHIAALMSNSASYEISYLRQGGYVFARVCLSVC